MDSVVVVEDRRVVAAVVVVVVEVVTHSGLCTSPSNLTPDITHQNSFGNSETSVRWCRHVSRGVSACVTRSRLALRVTSVARCDRSVIGGELGR